MRDIFRNPNKLGRRPKDLETVLAAITLGSPAVCALRALLRTTNCKSITRAFLHSAAKVAFGFRTLFNQPDVITLLQSLYPQKIYWQAVLEYANEGNLQAVLDEYMHILRESLGVMNETADTAGNKMADEIRTAVGLRAPSLRFDEISVETDQIKMHSHGLRCRYALRFGDERNAADNDGMRSSEVRAAFNSPFRPFVLATTSLGQEGLDFHQYCHRVVHWNLPTNPVDLEQREGRVHRYKGHVIRRNLAAHYGYRAIKINQDGWTDPWAQQFDLARQDRSPSANDLVPYWIYEGGRYKIERMVPILPLSHEVGRLKRLKETLVAYRSVIGQPRQQELLESLAEQMSPEQLRSFSAEFAIDLSPPNSSSDHD